MNWFNNAALQKVAPAIERAINAALTTDPGAQKHLRRLKDCVFEVHVSSAKQSFLFGVKSNDQKGSLNHQVVVLSSQQTISVQLKGSALSLLKLAFYQDKNTLFKNQEVQINGDAVRIQQIQAFMHSLNLDWEGLLANFVGDVPAHFLGSSVRSSINWGKKLSLSLVRDIEEFVKFELRLFPNKSLTKKQFLAIDKLYQATENLEKRLIGRNAAIRKEAEKAKVG